MLLTKLKFTALARGIIGPVGFYQLRKINQFQAQFSSRNDKKKLLILIIPVTTFCLGTWQVFRLQWKLGLIEDLEQKTKKPAVDIPFDIASHIQELEYCRVKLSGYFDHSKELLMWPRTLVTESRHQSSSIPGAYVITRFFCNELQNFILVNRGWVPKSRMYAETRPNGQIEGEVSLTAVVRSQEKRAPFSPKNDPEQNRWSWRDITGMAQYAETDPILVDADTTTTVRGGPIGGQTRVVLRNEHLQYVFTWYALSLCTFYLFWKLWKTKLRR